VHRFLIHRDVLNAVMTNRHLSTVDVAAAAGIAPSTLRNLRNGNRATVTEPTFMALAKAIDVGPSVLGTSLDVVRARIERSHVNADKIHHVEVIIRHERDAG
jgi:transcriptional regulator with XRE-family HTH domain